MGLRDLQSICQALTSKKAAERKRAAEGLITFLEQEHGVVKTLNHNSLAANSRDLFTWTDVFTAEEIYFEKETEKIHQNPHSVKQTKAQVLNVIVKTIRKSTGDQPFLPWSRIFSFLSKYLELRVYADIFGYSLISMMLSFLNQPLYVTLVHGSSWSELIQLLLRMYGRPNIPVTTVLECLNIAIRHGSDHPSVLSLLRTEVISFYQRAFESPERFKPYLAQYLIGLNVLCQKNSVESRGMLCQLGEFIVPKLIQSSCFDQFQVNVAIVEFLTVQLQLHSPCDVKLSSPVFYAADSGKWFEIVEYIYTFCIDSIEDIAKKKSNIFNKELSIPANLLLLAVKCTNQLVQEPGYEQNAEGEQPPKKLMTHKSFYLILEEVSKMQPSHGQIIWITYIASVLSEFPNLILSSANYTTLVSVGSTLLNSVHGGLEEISMFYRSLFICEKYLISQRLIDDHSVGTWDAVWNSSLKHLTTSVYKPETAELLRCLLVEVQPSNINLLLLTYVNRSLPVAKWTLLLLAEYLSRCALPMVVSVSTDEGESKKVCPRIALTRWLITKLDDTESSLLPLIASILVSLLVKRSHVLLTAEYDQKDNFHRPYMIAHEDFEKMILKVAFVDSEPIIEIKTIDNAPTDQWGTFKMVNNVAYHLTQCLQEDYETSLTIQFDKSGSDFARKLFLLQNRLVLQLNLINIIHKYEIGNNPDDLQVFKKNMETLFGNFLSRFAVVFLGFFNREGYKEVDQLSAILQNMRRLLQSSHLCQQTKVFFAQQFPQEVEQVFKITFKNGLHRAMESTERRQESNTFSEGGHNSQSQSSSASVNSDGDSDRTSNEIAQYKKATLEALNCLLDFAHICDHRSAILAEIFADCLNEEFALGKQFIFDLSSELITKISPILSLPSMSEIVESVLKMLQNLCRSFHSHPRCVLRLWELFAAVAGPIAIASDGNKKLLMTLIGGLSTFLNGNLPNGTHVDIQIAAFKLFNELLKHDRDLSWTVYVPRNSVEPIWILQDVCLHLNNPSHQVRFCVAETICNIFLLTTPSTKLIADSQLSIISERNDPDNHLGKERKILSEKLFPYIMETLFNIPLSLNSDERIEEGVNRTSIALFCLSHLIYAYPQIKKKSLVSLFTMIHRKNIKVDLACRALKKANPNATKELCSHFSYVFKKWLELSNPVKDFPHQLFEYNNQTDFYRKFKREICVQLFEHNSMTSLMDFSQQISVPHIDIITECFGILTARLTPSLTDPQHVKPTGVNDVHGRLTAILGGESVTNEMMSTHLGDIVLHLVSLCFNATVTSGWGFPSIKLPEPEVPYCSEVQVLECLNFLRETIPGQVPSIISHLSCTTPKSIYNILLSLASRIHEAHDLLEKFWRLHHFSMFINLLRQEPSHIFQEMKEYVCHFVIHAYLRLLKAENNKFFIQSVLFLLSELIQFLIQDCITEMKIYLHIIVSSLVSLSTKYPDHLSTIKKLLDMLILNPKLIDCVVSLDPFPEQDPDFSDYRRIYVEKKYGSCRDEWTLQRELQSCLDEVNSSSGRCTKERLEFIKDLLANRKREFEKLLLMDEERLFIHRLIQMLVDVVLKSENEILVREACRCLGEIGPLDLNVLVLPQCTSATKISYMANAVSAIIEIVAGYLTNDDLDLVVIAGQVLTSLLEVAECADILNEDMKSSEAKTRLGIILKPFLSKNPTAKNPEQVVDDRLLETNLNLNGINEHVDYPTWIRKFTCGLIQCVRPEGSISDRLMPLCLHKVEFCEEVLPSIVYVLLHAGKTNPNIQLQLSTYFKDFFAKGTQHLSGGLNATRSVSPIFSGGNKLNVPIFVNKLALRSLLKVVNFLRQHKAPRLKDQIKPSPWKDNFWLEIDYLKLAKIAQYCGAYLTSILYVEISSVDLEMKGLNVPDEEDPQENEELVSQNTSMYPRNRKVAAEMEKLLLKSYTKIGEEDAVYGCGGALIEDFESGIKHLEQRQQWSRVLSAQDSDSEGAPNDVGICRPLKELGLYKTLWTYLEGVQIREKDNLDIPLSELQYECGWRLSKWTLNCDKTSYVKDSPLLETRSAGSRFHKLIYESVQAGLAGDNLKHIESIQKGLEGVVIDLKHASLESSENLYKFMSHFQLLKAVEDFFANGNDQIDKLQCNWKIQDQIGCSNFKYLEPFLYLRAALLNSLNTNLDRPKLSEGYTECMLELLSKARAAGRLELAENCAVALGSCEKSIRKELEVSKNHWARPGEQSTATLMLRKLIKKNSPETTDLYANMMLLCGEWLSETMLQEPKEILKNYIVPGCGFMKNNPRSSTKEIAKAHFVVAKYADNLYRNVTQHMRSDLFLAKQRQLEASAFVNTTNYPDHESRKSAVIFRKQNSIEQNEIQTYKKEKEEFLLLALRHYLQGLLISNDDDLLVFRAVALWLENSIPLHSEDKDQLDPAMETNDVFAEAGLPSYKYIVVLHQLSARLGLSDTPVNCILNNILTKCAQEHPLHAIPILLTQSLLHKDQELHGKNTKKQLEERVVAAAHIVESLKKDSSLSPLLIKMETLWNSLINVANQKDSKKDKNIDNQRKQFSPKMNLAAIKGLEAVAVPTIYFPVSPSGDYDSFVGISGFDSFYSFVGGMNSPKRISCTGTNGIKYNMLLKGQDDLRQDAVMQQVFGVMNRLLLADSKTKTKRLTVRTYKVVPLSQRTGVLEWCENTQTFGDYLIGSDKEPGAHALYRPGDYGPSECRKKMIAVKDGRESVKIEVYKDIVEHFKPVFGQFFFEKFKEPGTYFDRRLAYTRSVATTSMVGYILGLGDRHVLNILIDKTTAELIHIDLGVAFEQSRILPTPETIPFRLTRDMVDGMGVSGIEGVFQKSCELTLEVLRNNSEIILTILEVLLYDPLYIWTLTADRVKKVQPTDSIRSSEKNRFIPGGVTDMRNNSAVRVLLRLRNKLAGIEEGESSGLALSVPGHVALLIGTATDPDKLGCLFHGWQPYL